MSWQLDTFKRALGRADTGDIEMSVTDWAQAVGVMTNYGHGYIWNLPKDKDGQVNEDAVTEWIEVYAERLQ